MRKGGTHEATADCRARGGVNVRDDDRPGVRAHPAEAWRLALRGVATGVPAGFWRTGFVALPEAGHSESGAA